MNKPTPEQLDALRVRISELCGYSAAYRHGEHWSVQKDGVEIRSSHSPDSFLDVLFEECPNYPADLDAMHDAEAALLLTERDREMFIGKLGGNWVLSNLFGMIHAEAWQRAVALDRTLSKEPIL